MFSTSALLINFSQLLNGFIFNFNFLTVSYLILLSLNVYYQLMLSVLNFHLFILFLKFAKVLLWLCFTWVLFLKDKIRSNFSKNFEYYLRLWLDKTYMLNAERARVYYFNKIIFFFFSINSMSTYYRANDCTYMPILRWYVLKLSYL